MTGLKAKLASRGLKFNLGSGQRKFDEPWINVDCQDKWEPDIVSSIEHLPMVHTGSADIVVLHHVIEHLGCGESRGMLKECRRILRVGGTIIICVPDMYKLCDAWLTGRINAQIFLTNVYGAYMGDEADRHKWGFDFISLQDELFEAGFRRVNRFNFRPIQGAKIARDWWVLAIEAQK